MDGLYYVHQEIATLSRSEIDQNLLKIAYRREKTTSDIQAFHIIFILNRYAYLTYGRVDDRAKKLR